MKNGVNITGDTVNKGVGTIATLIYCDDSSIEVITANATLAGFLIVNAKNPDPPGIGIYCDGTSPRIENNTIASCESAGIWVTGESSPIIKGNIVFNNARKITVGGIHMSGTSNGIIEENTISQNTGGGIMFAWWGDSFTGSPIIRNNTITNNCGEVANIVVTGGTPKIRNNQLTLSTGSGVIIYEPGNPDLGTTSDPGGNYIIGNTMVGLDLYYTGTTVITIEAVGNTWNPLTQGANISGLYTTSTTTQGVVALVNGNNYAIYSSYAFIHLK